MRSSHGGSSVSTSDRCATSAGAADHNGGVLRVLLILVVAALVGGCEWDGPPRDVRVVTADTDGTESQSGPGPGAVLSGDDTTAPAANGAPAADGRTPTGLEDRPGTFGTLDLPTTVAVVGDSLTVAATDELTDALSRVGVRSVIVDARESRRMTSGSTDLSSGVTAIEDMLGEHRPDLWIVALGTNDVGAEVGTDRFRADVRETLAAIPADAPVVWVDVWIRDRDDDVVELNAVLHRELAARPAKTEVVDWYSSGSIDGVITGDGIHLTAAGEARFASEIADAVVTLSVPGG